MRAIDTLEGLWSEGLSFSAIAKKLGITRDAAKGLGRRRGLLRGEDGRIDALKAWHASNRVRRPQPALPAPPPSMVTVAWPVTLDAATLCDLAPGQCHWPVGEASGSAQLFCGSSAGERGYCAEHAGVAFEVKALVRP